MYLNGWHVVALSEYCLSDGQPGALEDDVLDGRGRTGLSDPEPELQVLIVAGPLVSQEPVWNNSSSQKRSNHELFNVEQINLYKIE